MNRFPDCIERKDIGYRCYSIFKYCFYASLRSKNIATGIRANQPANRCLSKFCSPIMVITDKDLTSKSLAIRSALTATVGLHEKTILLRGLSDN